MLARSIRTLTTLGLVTFAAASAARAQASGRAAERVSTTYTLTAEVPAIVKVVVDVSAQGLDGNPVVRVVTNVRALRAMVTHGVAPEVLRQASVQYAAEGRGKGGEAAMAGNSLVDAGLVRYTIVQP